MPGITATQDAVDVNRIPVATTGPAPSQGVVRKNELPRSIRHKLHNIKPGMGAQAANGKPMTRSMEVTRDEKNTATQAPWAQDFIPKVMNEAEMLRLNEQLSNPEARKQHDRTIVEEQRRSVDHAKVAPKNASSKSALPIRQPRNRGTTFSGRLHPDQDGGRR